MQRSVCVKEKEKKSVQTPNANAWSEHHTERKERIGLNMKYVWQILYTKRIAHQSGCLQLHKTVVVYTRARAVPKPKPNSKPRAKVLYASHTVKNIHKYHRKPWTFCWLPLSSVEFGSVLFRLYPSFGYIFIIIISVCFFPLFPTLSRSLSSHLDIVVFFLFEFGI